MDRPSRIALMLALFFALSAVVDMGVWWAARLEYLAPIGAHGTIAAFGPALPWYLIAGAVNHGRRLALGIEMAGWATGLAINTWLIFAVCRYVGRRIRISWVRAV